jgi:hypothetical protein
MKECAERAFRSNSRQKYKAPPLANAGLTGCALTPITDEDRVLPMRNGAFGADLPLDTGATNDEVCPFAAIA